MDYQKEFKNALSSQPDCILGKNGITSEFVSHVNKLLKRYKVIKIKALRSVATKSNIKELANKIIYTYKNRDKLLSWGSYGRTITKTKYSWDKVTEDLEQFIINTSNTNI